MKKHTVLTALAGFALIGTSVLMGTPASAVEEIPVDPAPVVESVEVAFVPYTASARWLLPASWDYSVTPSYQQAIFPQDVLLTDPPACRWSQDDNYWIEDPAEQALFESLDDDGVLTQGEDAAIYASHVFTAGPACSPEYVTPTECEAFITLDKATESNPRGWGDLKNGVWTVDGIQLTATDTEEAYAYLDLAGADQYLLSTSLNGLDTTFGNATGSFGVIIHTDKANVHYDADGRYWTTTSGVFPETSAGFYSTYDLSELLQDATIDSVAVWVNPGGSLLLKAQEYNCFIQPFGMDDVVPTSVDLPTPSALAETGVELSVIGGGIALALLTTGILLMRRSKKRLV